MALAIATQTRGPQINNPLGGVNPFEMMHSMFELRNMQQQYQSNIEAGQILASSPDMNTAIERLRQSPNAAWQIPIINQIREGQLTQSHVQQTQWETDLSKAHAAVQMSAGGPDALMQTISDAKQHSNPGNGWLFDDIQKSLNANLPADPAGKAAMYEKNRIGLLIGTGLTSPEAYGARGFMPPGVQRVPGPMGGPDQLVPVGGVIPQSGAMGGPGVPQLGAGTTAGIGTGAATGPQMTQWSDLTSRQKELEDRVQAGQSLTQGINEATKILDDVQTGPLTPLRTRMAAVAKQLNWDDATVNLIQGAGSDTAAAQEMDKLFNQFALSRLGGGNLPGGRTLQQEYRDIVGSNPSLQMQKTAIERILKMWQRSYVADRVQQHVLSNYMTKHSQEPAAAGQFGSYFSDMAQRKGLYDSDYYYPHDRNKAIPPSDVIKLLANPDPESRKVFDRNHYPGSAARFLDED